MKLKKKLKEQDMLKIIKKLKNYILRGETNASYYDRIQSKSRGRRQIFFTENALANILIHYF